MLTGLGQLEFRILDWFVDLTHSDVLDVIVPKISFLGDGGWFWILLAVLFLTWKPTRKMGLTAALALLLSLLVANVILKPMVGRIRPFELKPAIQLLIDKPLDPSFPSGHTQASFAAATVIYRNKKWPGIAALSLATLIGLSRMYLYVHYASDVFAGAAIGYGLGCLADMVVNEIRYRHNAKKRRRPKRTMQQKRPKRS